MQELFSFSGLFNAVVAMVFAVVVVTYNNRRTINRLFFLMTMATALWSFGYWQWLCVTDDSVMALYWLRILSIGSTFVPIFFYHWVTKLVHFNFRSILWAGYSLTIFYCYFIFSDLFIAGVHPVAGFTHWPIPGVIYNFFVVTNYIGLVFGGIYLLIHYYFRTEGLKRMQIWYAMIGSLLGFGGGATNFLLWYGINIPPYGNFLVSFYVAAFGIAIVKYRFMDIRAIANKLYIYASLSVFGLALFYTGVKFEEAFLGGVDAPIAVAVNVIAVFIFSWAIFPIIEIIQQSGDTLFYRGNNPKKIIKSLALKLSTSINIDELMSILSVEFKKILSTEEVDVFLFQKDMGIKSGKEKDVCISILKNKFKRLSVGNIICSATLRDKQIIVRDEVERRGNKKMVDQLDKLRAKIISPLVYRGNTIGLIFLGEKIDGGAYNQDDIEFLEIISSQAAVAIENARLYKEVDDFNRTLQQKVDLQTKDITEKAEHLKKLMDMRSEFLDITSHQLRTPVTVIKGVLSMLEEGSIPPAKRKEFLRGAFEKSIKLGEIINDILRASEMDSERFELTLRPTDLNEILKKIEEDKLRTSQRKNINMKFRLPKAPLPLIMSDEKYIEQAIVNLINNAFQYTAKGSVTVSAEVLPEVVIIRVADTGIGIPENDIPKLYSKFARAENAVQTYTDGSGLGLFIIKQIVDATPGAKIEIEKTVVNKGTTFALTLPIAKIS